VSHCARRAMELPWGMGMSLADMEGAADEVCAIAGVEDGRCLYPSRIARRLFGDGSVMRIPNMRAMASLSMVGDAHVIAVRKSLPIEIAEHAVGHELGHWILNRNGYVGEDIEAACDFIGAAIQARRKAFSRRVREVGHDFRQLSLDFEITETSAALRYGEVTGCPIAVLSPKAVRVRGSEWTWGEEHSVRSRASTGEGVVRKTLGRKRVALIPEAA